MTEKADIIIITYNCKDFTLKCIKSLYDFNADSVNKIIIVDNNSNDDSIQTIEKLYPKIKIIRNSANLGYAKAVNIGVHNSETELVIVSNADVEFKNDSIKNLLNTFKVDDKIAIAGPQQFYPNGNPQYCWGYTPNLLNALKSLFFIEYLKRFYYDKITRMQSKIIDVDYADGAVLAIRRDIFDKLNGFDEDYFFYTEEADFCFRAKKIANRVVNNTASSVIHFRGASTSINGPNEKSVEMMFNSVLLFCKKHLSEIQTKYYFRIKLQSYKLIKLIYNSSLFISNKYEYKLVNINIYLKILTKIIKENGL